MPEHFLPSSVPLTPVRRRASGFCVPGNVGTMLFLWLWVLWAFCLFVFLRPQLVGLSFLNTADETLGTSQTGEAVVGTELCCPWQSRVLGASPGDWAADGACVVARVLERLQVKCEVRQTFTSSQTTFHFSGLSVGEETHPGSQSSGWLELGASRLRVPSCLVRALSIYAACCD